MRVRWTPPAANDLEAIFTYLSVRWPSYAGLTMQRLYAAAASLGGSPNRGRAARRGTRELVLTPLPYVIVYRVSSVVEILHIHHGAQDR